MAEENVQKIDLKKIFPSLNQRLKILIKFPTRNRPHKFEMTIRKYMYMAQFKDDLKFLISLDKDDKDLQKYLNIIQQFDNTINFNVTINEPAGKIAACNIGMHLIHEWDIVILASDDMDCQKFGWDEIIRQEMLSHYPDLDGVLFHNDGYLGQKLNTMCIMGRKYYEKFQYIYHPSYISLWCDNHFMEVANMLNKQTYFPECLFKHEHFSNSKNISQDALMRINESFYYKDKKIYEKLKLDNFGLLKDKNGNWTT